MEDSQIVDLYWKREETAIQETEKKYGRYLAAIAFHILADSEDSQEIVNDTYLRAWNSMPIHRPQTLSTFLGKIARQLAIDLFRKKTSKKRSGSQYLVSLEELEDCVSGGPSPDQEVELQLLAQAISTYLFSLPEEMRSVFVCRYFFLDSVREIAGYFHASESKIKSMLYRARQGLRQHLEREGYAL